MQGIADRINEYERRWKIQVFDPFSRAPNYVAPACCRDGSAAVIKIGRSGDDEIRTEIEALKFYRGEGSALLLESDPEGAVLLVERLEPGTPLSTMADDSRATVVLASLMKRLWRPLLATQSFPHIRDWALGIERYRNATKETGGPISPLLIDAARKLFNELIASMQQSVLVHGDLHHDNVLAAQRAPWLAIDPKGVIAEPAYETAALMRNPQSTLLDRPEGRKVMQRRIQILAEELGLEEQRILGWAIAQTVLSAVWSLEDHSTGWKYAVAVANQLMQIKTI